MVGVFVQLNDAQSTRPIGYIIQENGCWEWVGAQSPDGYGLWGSRAPRRAHRRMYEHTKGPIPDGLTLDHLCRNRGCVNPDHLEPVTRGDNFLRVEGHTAMNARKTHCKVGHPFNGANTYISERGRSCRTCSRDRMRTYRALGICR